MLSFVIKKDISVYPPWNNENKEALFIHLPGCYN